MSETKPHGNGSHETACPKHCWHTKYGRGGAGGDVCCHCGKSRELIVDKEHGPHNPNKVWEP